MEIHKSLTKDSEVQLIDISNYSLYDVTLGPSASMPKEGNPQLTECEKLQIESWINNGLPQYE